MKLIYICSSQFSGTTLLTFLLNSHARIATIGHTTGWKYAADEDFRCSCGERIRKCSLFRQVAVEFGKNGLNFDPANFGTAFKLSDIPRIDQLLIGPIPCLRSNHVERVRDSFVNAIPVFSRTLSRQIKANRVLMSTVLNESSADIYLDNSHSPYRMRRLRNAVADEICPIHLVRDPRGVCLSMMSNSGFALQDAINSWIRHQQDIVRIGTSVGNILTLRYEDLCREPNTSLGKIHDWVGIEIQAFDGNFKAAEHHILGNRMRIKSSEIRLDERWKHDLSHRDRIVIEGRLQRFCDKHADARLTELIANYLRDEVPDDKVADG